MRAGDLDRRVRLERATETRDAYNEPVLTWGVLAEVSAAYEPLSDGERFRASERASAAEARFRIRYSSLVADLSSRDRLVFEGAVHEIDRVKPIGRREGLEITTLARSDV